MTAATMPAPRPFVPQFARGEDASQVFMRVLRDYGYDAGDLDYTSDHGHNLSHLAGLQTFICAAPHEGSFHCPMRVSLRMAARVALGMGEAPRFRVLSDGWRHEMTGGEREQFLSYRGL